MDEISVESSDSSSCSTVSYENSQGYISDGEDPLVEPIDLESDDQNPFRDNISPASSEGEGSNADDYEEKQKRKQQRAQEKQIINQLKYGRNTARLLNKNPLIPTYQEIMSIIKKISQKWPHISIEKIVQKLHFQVIISPKQSEKEKKLAQLQITRPRPSTIPSSNDKQNWKMWVKKRRVAAESFIQLGYGIKLMKRFIHSNELNVEIDYPTYLDIMDKLLRDAYSRLERFLRKKCHKRVIKLTTPIQERILIEVLKNCTKKSSKFDSFEVRNFSKLIKPTYIKNRTFRLSKRIASRIYHTCKSWISKKKISRGYLNLDNPDSDFYNNDKDKWSEQMREAAVNFYLDSGDEVIVKDQMSKNWSNEAYLFDVRNIKYHIGCKVREGLKKVIQYVENNKKQPLNQTRIKEMEAVDNSNLNELINNADAANVRLLLCEVCKSKELTLLLLNQTILAINQFVLKKENDKMLQEIKKSDRQFDLSENSLSRRRRKQQQPQ